MKRKFLFTLICLLCFIVLVGCTDMNQEEKTYDEQFISDLKKGLMDRWDINDNVNIYKSELDSLNKSVDAELNRLSKYTDKKFSDSNLQERAIAYINLLNKQKEALTYYSIDYNKYDKMWSEAYEDRTQAVRDFIIDYDITFPEKYQNTVDEFMNTAKIATEQDELDTKVQEMLNGLTFSVVEDSYGYKTCRGTLENITDKTFSDFYVNIQLLDSNGTILETAYASTINLSPGQKANLEFYTETDYVSYELSADYYIEE